MGLATVVILSSSIQVVIGAGLGAIGLAALGVTLYLFRKKCLYEISLLYTMATQDEWWNEITPKIILGAVPLKNREHDEKISAQAVLTLLEDFELKNGLLSCPVLKEDWEKRNMEVLQIPAEDFNPLTSEQMDQAVAFINQQVEANRTVHIHCKAGRGRSAIAVIAYLLKYGGIKAVDEALAFVKEKTSSGQY
jgi:protein-tyrosine phosphatase